MAMYSVVLFVHSWLRWVALVAGAGAVVTLARNDLSRAERWGLVLLITVDVQLLLGLTLYFALSPFTTAALKNMSAAMANPPLRFFAVDHAATMILAVVAVHVGRVLGRKAILPSTKRRRLLAAFTVALLLMLVGIPWPGLPSGRPLFRF